MSRVLITFWGVSEVSAWGRRYAWALVALLSATSAAKADLVQNGSFEATTATYVANGYTVGTNVNDNNLAGWQVTNCAGTSTTCGFDLIATSNYATRGVFDTIDNHYSSFYAPPGASPDGGNAFISDGNVQTQSIFQAIGGLRLGDTYTVQFYQASMQQTGYSGAFTANWQVGLGSGGSFTTLYGSTMNNPSQSSTPWTRQSIDFVATATTETLYFFATASAGANPPFLLLDGVSMTDVPEPATLGLAAMGLAGVLMARRRRTLPGLVPRDTPFGA